VAKKPVEIDCEEVWRQISSYLDDEVDPGLRATMAAHFKGCARKGADAVHRGMNELRAVASSGGAYLSESNFFQTLIC